MSSWGECCIRVRWVRCPQRLLQSPNLGKHSEYWLSWLCLSLFVAFWMPSLSFSSSHSSSWFPAELLPASLQDLQIFPLHSEHGSLFLWNTEAKSMQKHEIWGAAVRRPKRKIWRAEESSGIGWLYKTCLWFQRRALLKDLQRILWHIYVNLAHLINYKTQCLLAGGEMLIFTVRG